MVGLAGMLPLTATISFTALFKESATKTSPCASTATPPGSLKPLPSATGVVPAKETCARAASGARPNSATASKDTAKSIRIENKLLFTAHPSRLTWFWFRSELVSFASACVQRRWTSGRPEPAARKRQQRRLSAISSILRFVSHTLFPPRGREESTHHFSPGKMCVPFRSQLELFAPQELRRAAAVRW